MTWEERLVRFQRLAELLERNGGVDAKMRGTIAAIESNAWKAHAAALASQHFARTVVAELNMFVTRARTAQFVASHPHRQELAEDLREESRLCIEEARETEEMEVRREVAATALDLALLGEQTARTKTK